MRFYTIISIVFFACGSRAERDGIHDQAIIIHNSMIKKADRIALQLNELKYDASVNQDSIRTLSSLFNKWQSSLVEVPGNPDHNHNGHSHDHHAPANITDEQMLEIQNELDVLLSNIGKRINQLKSAGNDENHKH